MKIFLALIVLVTVNLSIASQENRSEILKDLEKSSQEASLTATLKSASRLFGVKEDLTSVIMIIPQGSTVNITGSDSTYYKVTFEDNEGFIYRKHAIINATRSDLGQSRIQADELQMKGEALPKNEVSGMQAERLNYLQNKYGLPMAAKLYAGKVWKGMTSQMVRDSWGTPMKINRDIGGDHVREEWIYKNTWLFIENNILVNWGPVKE